jgi:hypothetical protein
MRVKVWQPIDGRMAVEAALMACLRSGCLLVGQGRYRVLNGYTQ